MKHLCTIIRFYVLGLQTCDMVARLEDDNTTDENENRVGFPQERNAFVFVI